jgi:hypothetical protein
MIEYEGNKLEDFVGEYLDLYRKKDTDKEALEKSLADCLKQVSSLDPGDIPDNIVDNILKTLMGKKFIGDSAIGLPMLSGLLSMRLPDHFAVVDYRVLEAIYKLRTEDFFPQDVKSYILKKWQNMRYENGQIKKINRKDYINYLKVIKGFKKRIIEGASAREIPLSDIDRALYAYHKYGK